MTLPAINSPVIVGGCPGYIVARSWGALRARPTVTVQFADGSVEDMPAAAVATEPPPAWRVPRVIPVFPDPSGKGAGGDLTTARHGITHIHRKGVSPMKKLLLATAALALTATAALAEDVRTRINPQTGCEEATRGGFWSNNGPCTFADTRNSGGMNAEALLSGLGISAPGINAPANPPSEPEQESATPDA